MQPSRIRVAQLCNAGLSFALGVSIVGTAGHALAIYNDEYSTNPWWLPLWSQHFDVRGISTLVGAGAVIAIFNLAILAFCLLPKFNLNERCTARALVTLGLAFPTLVVAFSCFVYAVVLDHKSPRSETIRTWSCKFKGSRPAEAAGSVPIGVSNQEFGRLCAESTFALYTTLVVVLLQGLLLILAAFGWCIDQWHVRKQRRQTRLDDDSVEMDSRGHKELPFSVFPDGLVSLPARY